MIRVKTVSDIVACLKEDIEILGRTTQCDHCISKKVKELTKWQAVLDKMQANKWTELPEEEVKKLQRGVS